MFLISPVQIFLLSVLFVGYSVHTPHHLPIYDKQAYLQSMQSTKLRVLSDWQAIRNRIQQLKSDINNTGTQDQLRLTQEALADERDILLRVQQYIGLPFQLKSCQCLNFSSTNKTSLLEKISQVRDQLMVLKKDIVNCPSCDRTIQLGNEVVRQEQYIESMRKAVESDCCKFITGQPIVNQTATGAVDLNQSIFITNTLAFNWIYGNISEQQYNIEKFALASKFNTTKCPINRPFAKSSTECIDCVQPNWLWDLGRGQCTSCTPGYIYDAGRRACVERPHSPKSIGTTQFISNLNASNILAASKPLKQYYNQQDNLRKDAKFWQICPPSTPFLSRGGICISCPQNKPLFNLDTRQCTTCPEGTSYIPSLKNCTVNIYMTNLLAPRILQTDRMTLKEMADEAEKRNEANPYNMLVACPIQYPYFDGRDCIQCPDSYPLFNLETQRCERCPYSLSYNYKIRRCGQYQYTTSPYSPNLFLQGEKLEAYKQLYDSQKTKGQYLDCPSETPYFDGFQCIKCTGATPIFDLLRKRCMRCPDSTYFDGDQNTCVSRDVNVPATVERALMNIK